MVSAFKKLTVYKSKNSEQRVDHEAHRESQGFLRTWRDIQSRTSTELQHRLV